MTEWGVVTVVVVLLGLLASILALADRVTKPMKELNDAIKDQTKTTAVLDVTVKGLRDDLSALTTRNSESHDRIFRRLDEDESTLADHETRISVIEHGRTK